MYRDTAGQAYTVITSKSGDVEQWRLMDDGAGQIDAEMVRAFDVGPQLEGCVADDELGRLYIGEEDVSIWGYVADPDGGSDRTLVAETSDTGPLVSDVEGLTIAYGPDGTGYLIASSQGNSTFAVYERTSPHDLVMTFAIGDGFGIDGVDVTDGIDVTTANLGSAYPQGLFVAHDGENEDENQNYKLVPWNAITSEITESRDG